MDYFQQKLKLKKIYSHGIKNIIMKRKKKKYNKKKKTTPTKGQGYSVNVSKK